MRIASSRKKLEELIRQAKPKLQRLFLRSPRSFDVKAEKSLVALHRAAARLATGVKSLPSEGPVADELRARTLFELDCLRNAVKGESLSPSHCLMYANAARKTFEAILRMNSSSKFERRILNDRCQHCDDCKKLAAKGWQPINTLPAPGDSCQCLSNCQCRFEFMNSRKKADFSRGPWDESKVRRGQPENAGRFARKASTAPPQVHAKQNDFSVNDAVFVASQLLNVTVSPDDLASLFGAVDGAKVAVGPFGEFLSEGGPFVPTGLIADVRHKDYFCRRVLRRGPPPHLYNEEFQITDEAASRNASVAPPVMSAQIETAKKLGVPLMRTYAAGRGNGQSKEIDKTKNDRTIGYYVWPLYGYDSATPDAWNDARRQFIGRVMQLGDGSEIDERMSKVIAESKSVRDFIADGRTARDLWFRFGVGHEMSFDLYGGDTKSLRIFEAYMDEKKRRQQSQFSAGTAGWMSDDDESIIEHVWDRIAEIIQGKGKQTMRIDFSSFDIGWHTSPTPAPQRRAATKRRASTKKRTSTKRKSAAKSKDWDESKHKRGQPKNKGQFAKAASAAMEKAESSKPTVAATSPHAASAAASTPPARQSPPPMASAALDYSAEPGKAEASVKKSPNRPKPSTDSNLDWFESKYNNQPIDLQSYVYDRNGDIVLDKAAAAAKTLERVQSVFGKGSTVDDVVKACGAIGGSKVSVSILPDDSSIRVNIRHPHFHATRWIGPMRLSSDSDEIGKVIYNSDFSVTEAARHANVSVAPAVIASQIKYGRKLGCKMMSCYAAGNGRSVVSRENKSRQDDYIGYYVWPLYGYDCREQAWPEIVNFVSSNMKTKGVSPEVIRKLKESKSIQGFFHQGKDCRDAWYENGFGMSMQFDLSEGSKSVALFSAYLEEKRRRNIDFSATAGWVSDDDMQIIEAVWRRMEMEAKSPIVDFSWDESKHKRGGSKNKGQFAKKSETSAGKPSEGGHDAELSDLGVVVKNAASTTWNAAKKVPSAVADAISTVLTNPKAAFRAIGSAIASGAMAIKDVFMACEHAVSWAFDKIKNLVPSFLHSPFEIAAKCFMSSYVVAKAVLRDAYAEDLGDEKADAKVKYVGHLDLLGSKAMFSAVMMAGGGTTMATAATMIPVASTAMLIHAAIKNPQSIKNSVVRNWNKVKDFAKKTGEKIKMPDGDVMQAMTARFSVS